MKDLKTFISVLALSAVIGISMTACDGTSNKKASNHESQTVSSRQSDSSENLNEPSADNKNSDETNSSETIILESNTESIKETSFYTDSSIKAVKEYKTLDEYIKSDTAKEAIDDIEKNDDENSLPIDSRVKTEKNTKLVFERTINEELEYPEAFLKTLESTMDSQQKTYTKLVNVLESCVDNNNLNVVVRYFDCNGNKIFERTFDEKGVVKTEEISFENSDDNGNDENGNKGNNNE